MQAAYKILTRVTAVKAVILNSISVYYLYVFTVGSITFAGNAGVSPATNHYNTKQTNYKYDGNFFINFFHGYAPLTNTLHSHFVAKLHELRH